VTLPYRRLLPLLALACALLLSLLASAQTSAAGPSKNQQPTATEPQNTGPQFTDSDRAAIRITSYDLDIRLSPATSQLTGRARLTLTNTSDAPLPRIALQISSSLTWASATLQGQTNLRLPIAQHLLDTDADHTGRAKELILNLPTPLAPGANLTLDTFYSGPIQQNSGRLDRLGIPPSQAATTDWDSITSDATALRGFGNVLWFPIAAPQLFLSDGTLVPAIGKARLDHAKVKIHLRLSVEYIGEPPTAAYFCGRRQPLSALHDNSNAPIAFGSGIATADFPSESIGIRPLSLFILPQPENLIAPLPTTPQKSTPQPADSGTPMLAVETTNDNLLTPLAASAEQIAPLLQDWFGIHPLSALTILDHPGQPFEDGPLLVAPIASLATPAAAPLLAHSLTHAWVQTGQPWMDEGLAEFVSLLWTEREKGRDAAIAQLDTLMQPVIAAETAPTPQPATIPDTTSSSSSQSGQPESAATGQPLIDASDETFYRRKATAVWWMLRDIAGQQPLQLALSAWRTQPPRHDSAEAQAHAFEALLEKTSGKDLGWFFNDWVLEDRGLPELSIVDVTPRQLPAGAGHSSGWLVAVTMHNQGAAAAEVPLIIHSGAFSITKRIHISGHSDVTDREVIESAPTEVTLNDGSTPETGPTTHTRNIVLHNE
jgi:hypothetical protein